MKEIEKQSCKRVEKSKKGRKNRVDEEKNIKKGGGF